MNKRIVTVGDLVVDVLMEARLPLNADDHQSSPLLRFEPGGACSTILAARNMGLEVAALGTVGDDFQGRLLIETLAAAGVDLSALVIPTGSTTTTVLVLVDSRGGHVFLGHYGSGAPIEMTAAARRRLAQADALFIPGYALVEARLNPLTAAVFDFLESAGTPLYVDVGPFMGQLPPEALERVLRLSAVLLLTEAEIPLITGGRAGLDACRQLIADFPHLQIVLKRAAAGCHLLSTAGETACAGYRVPVSDAVGAGDCFAAALMWAQLHSFSPRECGIIANAMGAASVQKRGAGANAPTLAEVQQILDTSQTGVKLIC